jgi:hypothetical protein
MLETTYSLWEGSDKTRFIYLNRCSDAVGLASTGQKVHKITLSRPGLTIAVSGDRKYEARAFEHCELWWHLTCQPQKKNFTFGLSHKENAGRRLLTGLQKRTDQHNRTRFLLSLVIHGMLSDCYCYLPLGHLPPLLTYTAYDYCMSHSLLLTNTV